ncbi:MAG: MoaD/ThiS family protein [Oscillospiraceae bacterium]|nr:MoaD/ThiS family protein [Oscillospiraceae bacterium]
MDAAMVKDMNAINEAVKRRKALAMAKISLEQKKKAVEIAVSGGNPLEYLKKCGSSRPDGLWYTIKENLKKVDPDTYAKLPDYRGKTRSKPANYGQPIPGFEASAQEEEVPTVKVDGPIRIETIEPEKVEVVETPEPATVKKKVVDLMKELNIRNPLQYEEFTVRAVEGEFGRYFRDVTNNGDYIDYESKDGEELSMTIEQWKHFVKELTRAAQVLGVEL